MKKLLASLSLAVLSLAALDAFAQGVSVLNPMAPSYKLYGFTYEPPKGDGWRELGYAMDALRIVYAEQTSETQINTRADFTVQAFPIDEPSKAPEAAQLAQLSMTQRIQEKGESLVAMSQVQPVEGKLPIYEYTLIVKVEGADVAEHNFVALAPDKTQYLAAKLLTKDTDFRAQPFYAPLQESMQQGLQWGAAAKEAGSAAAANPADPTPAPADAAPAASPPAAPTN
jgi:hypothetical protein